MGAWEGWRFGGRSTGLTCNGWTSSSCTPCGTWPDLGPRRLTVRPSAVVSLGVWKGGCRPVWKPESTGHQSDASWPGCPRLSASVDIRQTGCLSVWIRLGPPARRRPRPPPHPHPRPPPSPTPVRAALRFVSALFAILACPRFVCAAYPIVHSASSAPKSPPPQTAWPIAIAAVALLLLKKSLSQLPPPTTPPPIQSLPPNSAYPNSPPHCLSQHTTPPKTLPQTTPTSTHHTPLPESSLL